jgi:hypothetical protein
MFMASASGLFIAVGHHLFYENLDGQEVPSQRWKTSGIELTTQQVNIALGTALAFLVKVCLVLAVSSSYTQAIWSAAKASKKGQHMSIADLDAAFSALGNLGALSKLHLWAKHPLMLSLVAIAW